MRVMTVEEYIKLPTFVRKVNKFQNVNIDKDLRKMVTDYFRDYYLDVLKKTKNKNVKSFYSEIKGKKGFNIVYNLIKLYIKKTGKNWYDLKKEKLLVIHFFNDYLSHY